MCLLIYFFLWLIDGKCIIKNDNPYSGQIRLYNDTSYLKSSGILYLYYDNEWLPVCARSLKQNAADSACRQLGYTNAGGHKETYVTLIIIIVVYSSEYNYH